MPAGELAKYDLVHHLFADNTQVMLHCLSADIPQMMSKLNDCFVDVSRWCTSKRLQLNDNKTELLLFGTATSLTKIPVGSDVMQAGSSDIKSADVVRDLGMMLDAQLTMHDHISRTAQACFFHLRRLRSVRQLLGCDVTIWLIVALVFSRFDCCNAVLAGFTGCYTSTVAASSPRRRSFGGRSAATRPRNVSTRGTPLVADSSTN
jgi:hypothetical protein